MKILLTALIFLVLINMLTYSENKIIFDPNRIETGNLYIYQLSANPEKFKPNSRLYYYLASINKDILNYKLLFTDRIKNRGGFLIDYKFNRKNLMIESGRGKLLIDPKLIKIKENKNYTVSSKLEIDLNTQRGKSQFINIFSDKKTKTFSSVFRLPKLPTFFYHFWHSDLWTFMRFVPVSIKKIDAGDYNIIKKYYADVIIHFEKREEIEVEYGKVICLKYVIYPSSLLARLVTKNKKNYVWMADNGDAACMVKYIGNIPYGSNPRFELQLSQIKKKSQKQWDSMIAGRKIK